MAHNMDNYPFQPTPSPPSSSSSSSDCTASPPAYTPPKTTTVKDKNRSRKKQRNGKVVGQLRLQIGTTVDPADVPPAELLPLLLSVKSSSSPPTHLGPTSTTYKLALSEMQGALTRSLLLVAGGDASAPTSPPVFNLDATVGRLRLNLLKSKTPDRLIDIDLAALLALGSRRSEHSQITGGLAIDDGEQGFAREATCRALADRAIELAEEHNIFKDTSAKAQETIHILRVMLWCVAPEHPAAQTLGDIYIREHLSSPSFGKRTPASDSVVTYDAYQACKRGEPCRILDGDLWRYGHTPSMLEDSIALLDHLELFKGFDPRGADFQQVVQSMRAVGIHLIRQIVELKLSPLATITDIREDQFDRLQPLLTIFERSIQLVSSNCLPFARKILPSIGAIPLFCECHLLDQAVRFANGDKSKGGVKGMELVREREEGLLNWLKVWVVYLDELPNTPAGHHSRAVLLSSLDHFDGWVDVAVAACECEHAGSEQFGWEDLERVHRHLVLFAAMFASSSRRLKQIERALEARSSVVEVEEVKPDSVVDELAQVIFEQALLDVE